MTSLEVVPPLAMPPGNGLTTTALAAWVGVQKARGGDLGVAVPLFVLGPPPDPLPAHGLTAATAAERRSGSWRRGAPERPAQLSMGGWVAMPAEGDQGRVVPGDGVVGMDAFRGATHGTRVAHDQAAPGFLILGRRVDPKAWRGLRVAPTYALPAPQAGFLLLAAGRWGRHCAEAMARLATLVVALAPDSPALAGEPSDWFAASAGTKGRRGVWRYHHLDVVARRNMFVKQCDPVSCT